MGMLRVLSGVAVAALAVTSARADSVATLKAGVFVPPQSSYGWPFKRWVDQVNKSCSGKVEITVIGPEAIPSFEQPQALKSGVLDMASSPPAYYQGIVPEGDAQTLAEISAVEQRKSGAWAYINKLHEEKLNAHYLTFYGDGVKFFIYTTKPMKDGSLAGLRMRSVPIFQAFFEKLGASTSTLPISNVYTALERGVVDGTGFPLWGVTDFGWQKFLKYRYEPGFYNSTANILVNLDRWRAMSEDQRKCLNDMALWLEREWPAWRNTYNKEEISKQKKAGISVVDLGPAHAKEAHDIYWAKLEKASPKHISALKKLLTR